MSEPLGTKPTERADIRGALPCIGPIHLAGRILLSPMAGITDAPFRKIARQFGAALTASEMTTADTSLWNTSKSQHRLDIDLDAEPRVVQIAGSDPIQMARAAEAVVARGADIVDINMGCPAKKVCKKLAGSALLQDPPLVESILRSVVSAVDVPVTLKTRLGWNRDNENIVDIAKTAEQSGIAAIAIHGRTRACAYKGEARHARIADVKSSLTIPVFANGDIDSPKRAREVLDQTGADGLLIGRATQGRPWILKEISELVSNGTNSRPLSNPEMRAIIRDHLDVLHAFYGERKGVLMARKHLNWYARGLGIDDQVRRELLKAPDIASQRKLAFEVFYGADSASAAAA
ncbi:MAG: tRNA dihydrouridine synthase DusB [Pseudomonadota bacterium]